MKDTKGLQIGNLLYYKGTDNHCEVSLIHGKNHYDCRDEYGSFIPNGEYEPIQLTQEWLLQLGFKETAEDFLSIKTKKKGVYLEINLKTKRTILFDKGYVELVFTKHVHQLQNLYFALTNKELILCQ